MDISTTSTVSFVRGLKIEGSFALWDPRGLLGGVGANPTLSQTLSASTLAYAIDPTYPIDN